MITSANTSINKTKPPAIIKLVDQTEGWKKEARVLDLGCGKYPELILTTEQRKKTEKQQNASNMPTSFS